jgi:hypothetical protein
LTAERTAPDDQDVSFRFGVRILIAGMRELLAEWPSVLGSGVATIRGLR